MYSIGISEPNGDKSIYYQPGLERTYDFTISGADKIHSYIEGDAIVSYATLTDPNQDGSPRGIQVTVKFPEEPINITPGWHTLYVGGIETKENPAMFGTVANIRTTIPILILYPGTYPISRLISSDVNIGEKTDFIVHIMNYGKQNISSAHAVIDVLNLQTNETITTLSTNTKSISSTGAEDLTASFDTAPFNLSAGNYLATAHIIIDDSQLPDALSSSFRVGTLNVEIINWSQNVIVNATNKFQVIISSGWSGTIDNVYARITFPNEKTPVKTPNLDLTKFQQTVLETYWETKNLNPGTYDVQIIVYYGDTSVSKTVPVNVIEGVAPIIERPKSTNNLFGLPLTTTNIMLLIFGVLIVVNLIIVILFLRKRPPQPPIQNKSPEPPKV